MCSRTNSVTTAVGSALELGCGPGTWTPLLARRAQRVVAVDLSTRMLEQARAAVLNENVTFVNADAARYSTDSKFDIVMSVRVLEYIPEWRSILAKLQDLVAPDGRAVIVTKTPVSVWRGTGRERWFGPHTMARRITGRKLDDSFWQEYLPVRDVRQAFVEGGFTDIRVRPVIFGLPVYVRGTKQYPLLPASAEPRALAITDSAWRWVSRHGARVRMASLPLSESYAVSGRRRSPGV